MFHSVTLLGPLGIVPLIHRIRTYRLKLLVLVARSLEDDADRVAGRPIVADDDVHDLLHLEGKEPMRDAVPQELAAWVDRTPVILGIALALKVGLLPVGIADDLDSRHDSTHLALRRDGQCEHVARPVVSHDLRTIDPQVL